MAAGREAHHADALGMEAPFASLAPYQADGPLGILERAPGRFPFRLIRAARHPIFENDASHTNRVQPGRDFLAFQLPVEIPVAAAGTNEHRRPRVLFLRRTMDGDGWSGDR